MPGPNLLGTAAQLRNSLNTIISRVDLLRDDSGIMRPLMTELPLPAHSGRSYVRDTYNRLVAQGLIDGADMNQQQDMGDAQVTYTPNEVGVQAVLPKTTIRRSFDANLENNLAQIIEHAYSLKEDQDCCAVGPSFTNQLGGATTVLGIGHVTAAAARLRVGNNLTTPEPFTEDLYFVAHPCSLHAVAMRMLPLTDVPVGTNVYATTSAGATVGPGRDGTGLSEDIMKQGRLAVKMLGQFKVMEDANVQSGANSGFHSIAFARAGAVFCSEFEPEFVDEFDGSLRAQEMNYVGSYGTGVFRPAAAGIDMFFDATLPTA